MKSGYKQRYVPTPGQWHNRPNSIKLYLPCRTAIILIAEENITQDIAERGQIVMPPIQEATKAPINQTAVSQDTVTSAQATATTTTTTNDVEETKVEREENSAAEVEIV